MSDLPERKKLDTFCYEIAVSKELRKYYSVFNAGHSMTLSKEIKGVAVPLIQVYVADDIGEKSEKALETKILLDYKLKFPTFPKPSVLINSSAKWFKKYNGEIYHFCSVDSPTKPDFNDYEIYRIDEVAFEVLSRRKYPNLKGDLDREFVAKIRCDEEETLPIYKEIFQCIPPDAVMKTILEKASENNQK